MMYDVLFCKFIIMQIFIKNSLKLQISICLVKCLVVYQIFDKLLHICTLNILKAKILKISKHYHIIGEYGGEYSGSVSMKA